MNRFELWDKVARNWQYWWQQPFRSVVTLWYALTLWRQKIQFYNFEKLEKNTLDPRCNQSAMLY